MRLLAGAAAFLILPMSAAGASAEECGREAFSNVVAQASAELAAMNEAQKMGFHEKLQLLKARQGWPDSDYVAKATPYVQDGRIVAFDEASRALLGKIPQLGAAVNSSPALAGATPSSGRSDPRCAMLGELRGLMAEVVANARAKWNYMLGKVDTALGDAARQAKAER